MSDYLWEKKGEPDGEVARLEALLGAFAHAPRPLELPDDALVEGARPARLLPFAARLRASRLFAPAALAAAAALVVALVLVASAFLRAPSAVERAGAPGPSRPEAAPKDGRAAPPEGSLGMLEPPPGALNEKPPPAGVKVKDEKVAVESLPRGARRRRGAQLAALPPRRRAATAEPLPDVAGGGLTVEAMRAGGGPSALVEGARQLAKEQLVYALRLTGAKLRDVREMAGDSRR